MTKTITKELTNEEKIKKAQEMYQKVQNEMANEYNVYAIPQAHITPQGTIGSNVMLHYISKEDLAKLIKEK